MNISVDEVSINPYSLERELLVEIMLEYQEYLEVPISIHGVLTGKRGKELGKLSETVKSLSRPIVLIPTEQVQQRQINDGSKRLKIILACQVTERSLDFIEKSRIESRKGDVELGVKILVKYLSTSLRNLGIREQFDLLRYSYEELYADYTISRSDWIQDFSEKLGIGKILIIEHKTEKLNQLFVSLSTDTPEVLLERMERSLLLLNDMEDGIRSGNWKQVLRYAREFFELIRLVKKDASRIQMLEYFKERNGSEIGFDKLYEGVQLLHDYMSKFIHHKSQEGHLQVKPKAQQEDAYFIYSLCNSLTYLILNKMP